jgi:hypothetical protein
LAEFANFRKRAQVEDAEGHLPALVRMTGLASGTAGSTVDQ